MDNFTPKIDIVSKGPIDKIFCISELSKSIGGHVDNVIKRICFSLVEGGYIQFSAESSRFSFGDPEYYPGTYQNNIHKLCCRGGYTLAAYNTGFVENATQYPDSDCEDQEEYIHNKQKLNLLFTKDDKVSVVTLDLISEYRGDSILDINVEYLDKIEL